MWLRCLRNYLSVRQRVGGQHINMHYTVSCQESYSNVTDFLKAPFNF